MRLTRKIGIMGGTFDPIHFGHLHIAWSLLQAYGLDEVRFIPCGVPAHREQPVASAKQRLNMLEYALNGNDKFILDDREISRDGPSYMIETLKSLQTDFPDATLCLMLGMDAFNGLQSWHDWQELVNYTSLLVVRRAPYQLPVEASFREWIAEQEAAGKVEFAQAITQLEISGTKIRQAIQENHLPKYLVPDAVLDYIITHKLYGDH